MSQVRLNSQPHLKNMVQLQITYIIRINQIFESLQLIKDNDSAPICPIAWWCGPYPHQSSRDPKTISYIFIMSLLIVGSCSRVTANIVLALAKNNLYSSITIADVLPLYDHHHRYYKLRRQLSDQKSTLPVTLEKLLNIQTLHKQITSHQDVLHVTHDYFTSVTSKKKLMELTATLSKNKSNVLYAAPIEYDHFGEANPQQLFLDAKAKVKQINPNAGFIRCDVQDSTEVYAYIYKSKKIWEEKLLQTPDSFKPKVVSSNVFTEQVVEHLGKGSKGADIVVRGEKERHYSEVAHNKELEDIDLNHHVENIRLMVTKYRGPEDRFSTLVTSKFV